MKRACVLKEWSSIYWSDDSSLPKEPIISQSLTFAGHYHDISTSRTDEKVESIKNLNSGLEIQLRNYL